MKEDMEMYKKLMVPLDGSDLAECVVPHVEAIAKGCETEEIILLRVVEPERMYRVSESAIDPNLAEIRESERKKNAAAYLDTIVKRFADMGLKTTPRALVGRVAERLIDYCMDERVDLIIIVTHGRSGITRWVRGSVADRILRTSLIPVMMIRAPGTEHGV
jgi:nucleotide-binding universal stress UspA family protein